MVKIINSLTLPDGNPPPKIKFPCKYPIKILGESNERFVSDILEIVSNFSPSFERESVSLRKSKKENFCALTVTIDATGKNQIDELYKALKDSGLVKMVL